MTMSRNQPFTTDHMARLNPSALAREAEDPMSTQPNRIIPRVCDYSIREAPVNQKYAARFLNLHPKTVLRKAREGSLPAHPVGKCSTRWFSPFEPSY
jgi:hypothetical protein